MGIGNLFQKDLCQHTPGLPALLYSCQATVYPHLLRRLLNTHRQVWLNLLWVHCSFLPDPGVHKVLFVTPRVCSSSPVEFLQSNLTGLQNEIPWGFSDHLLGPQAGKSIVDHRTITKESIPKSDLLYSLRPKMEKLNKQSHSVVSDSL